MIVYFRFIMGPVAISLIIVSICLVLGAIGVGIYVAVYKSKPENKGKSADTSTIVLIMTISLLLGLLITATYMAVRDAGCQECIWGPKDVEALKFARSSVSNLSKKANSVPKGLATTAICDAEGDGCGL